jgi:5-methylthioadenosine/S-adenosylhomocysteine deaminase
MNCQIVNATIITLNAKNEIIENGEIHIKDGIIQYVGESGPAFAADKMMDANRNVVMPGFVNTHTHITMNLLRSYADDMNLKDWLDKKILPAEDKFNDEISYWGALHALCEMAKNGTVALNDMYFYCNGIARAIEQSGHRAVISRGTVDPDPQTGERTFNDALQIYKKYNNVERIRVYMGPHAQYTASNGLLLKIAQTAKELKTGIHMHISETKREHEQCVREHGKTPIALAESLGLLDVPFLAAHCVYATEGDMELLKEKGAAVLSCPQSNLKLASGIAPILAMMEKGVLVSLGTDGAASNNNLSMWEEMTYASLLQKGTTLNPEAVPAMQALRLATQNGAKALGINSGSLEAGKNADLIIVDTGDIRYIPNYSVVSNIVYAGSDRDVLLTMVGGDILYEDGRVTFADEDEVKERVREIAEKIKT